MVISLLHAIIIHMEILHARTRNTLAIATLSATALAGCSIDSYLTDPSNIHCDSRRTISELSGDSVATFVVHGREKGDVATIKVRRTAQGASVNVSGDITGPPQQLEKDGYTAAVAVVDGPELSAFGAGGAWVIDVRQNSVVIQGSCDGM